jgi:hypothetical protein
VNTSQQQVIAWLSGWTHNMQPLAKAWQAKNCNIFLASMAGAGGAAACPAQIGADKSGANLVERSRPNTVAFDVGCWTLGVRRFLCPKGRVAESGLRHSTRNRAWGNPPWVRIPPLPPRIFFRVDRSVRSTQSTLAAARSHTGGGENGKSDA